MRSFLFVPADDRRKLAKARLSQADALILDLEDSIGPDRKQAARQVCAEFLGASDVREQTYFVRVNSLDSGIALDDLAAVVAGRPDGIMLPKCSGWSDVVLLDHYLAALEARENLEVGSIQVLPIITETAASVLACNSFIGQRSGRVVGLMWGGEDLAADIGAQDSREPDGRYNPASELARTLCLLASTALEVPAVDAVFTNFRDSDGLALECERSALHGFGSKAAIHPDQVDVINRAFAVSSAKIASATRIVEAFSQSSSGAIAVDGVMLDRPHYVAALKLLSRAGRS